MSGKTRDLNDPRDREKETKERDPCDLTIDIDLEGLRQGILTGLALSSVLNVRLLEQGGFQAVVCETNNGDVVGALSAFKGLSTLVKCLTRGERYQVAITALESGRCHVFGGRVVK